MTTQERILRNMMVATMLNSVGIIALAIAFVVTVAAR